ncbi:hypothetical protein [Asaia sp. VD9]|uniref:hypothetical protein n=1 Tax=Asaia sp. VD9 TaxID=3081235 RepID=UPI003015E115
MVSSPLSRKMVDDAPQSAAAATPPTYRSFATGNIVACRVNMECRPHPAGSGLARAASKRVPKHEKGTAGRHARKSPPAILAGSGLCVALICAFADGFLTADQAQPLFAWMRLHQPVALGTGMLSYLTSHWPASQFHWAPPVWIGFGLVTALAGKGALLPAQRVAQLAGKHAVLTLRFLLLVVGVAGAVALVSSGGTTAFPTARHALTSMTRTITLPATSLGE